MSFATRWRLFGRPIPRATLLAVLAFALTATLLGAPAHQAPAVSATRVCEQSATAVEAAFTTEDPAVKTGPVARAAGYPPTGAQAASLDAKKQQAIAACESRLKAQTAGWSYLSARAVEIAVDAVITILASTAICSAAPTACWWGVRIASFLGGFFGAMAFQYLTYGTIDWASVGSAFFDATVSMLAFSGLDKLEETYIENGVKATFQHAGQAVTSVARRIGGLGSGFISYVQSFANYIMGHNFGAFPASASRGGARFESVLSVTSGGQTASSLQVRDPAFATGTQGGHHSDLYSGSYNSPYYDWSIQKLSVTNGDGAYGYLIGQGGSCLTNENGSVLFSSCNSGDNRQWWFADGDELMAGSGKCLIEVPNAAERATVSCDGLNAQAGSTTYDDLFQITPDNGTYIAGSISDWKNHWKTYM